jgi:predicted CXXCH cytochrome family protein
MAGFFMFTPALDPGMNTFFVRALGAKSEVLQSQQVQLFYSNDYTSDAPDEPEVRAVFHGEPFEEHCSGCHDVEIPESALTGGESVEDQCSACHSSFQNQTSSHFPVTAWDCISCHDAGATPAFALRAEKDFDTAACFECHVGVEEAVTQGKVIHFPATDRCMSCHDAHSSPSPSLLVDDVYTICASCHEDAATTPHPVVNHPVKTVQKPSKEAAELNCASCHAPHASEYAKLLTAPRKGLCKNCHNF